MKVFVTGAAGFIASHLISKLLDEGEEVVGIDNFDPFYDRSIKEFNIKHLNKSSKFSFYEGDLSDKNLLQKIFTDENIGPVVHLAAKAGVRPSLKNPTDYVKVNIESLVNLLDVMKEFDKKKFIFASSSSIYGKNSKIPFSEADITEKIISVYAASKISGESFTRMYHNLYDFSVINLRFFTVYGPSQRPDLAIHKFLKAAYLDEEITLFGDGSMARDYTYVEDTVAGIIGAIKRISNLDENLYETFNLGNSTPISLKELIESIEEVTGKKIRKKCVEVPDGDVPITYADISRSKEFLGYSPETTLKDGLKKMYEWIELTYKR